MFLGARPESQVPTDLNGIIRTLSLIQGGEIFHSSGIGWACGCCKEVVKLC